METEWNVSKLATLRQCQTKFFFGYEIARHEFTHPFRRKAFELSKVKTLKMWQGSIVDHVVTTVILPCFRTGKMPDYASIAEKAVDLAKRQYNYSYNHYYRQQDISRSEVGHDFLILDIHEFNVPYEETEIVAIYQKVQEIILAFPNYPSPENGKNLGSYLASASFLRADARNLAYTYGDVTIKPQIDAVRYLGKSIHVIDWKVAERDDVDYSRQLVLAGIVSLHDRRKRFRENGWFPKPLLSDVSLFEINLMNGQIKQHAFNRESTAIALDYVSSYAKEQEQLSQFKAWNELDMEDYDRTDKAETCITCKFKPLCKHMLMNKFKYDEDEYTKLVQNKELV